MRIKFIEVPAEYTTPVATIAPPAFLYHFTEALPNGSANEWFYTSYEDSITYGGHTYTPAPFSHGKITSTLNLSDKVQLTSWGGSFTDNPLNRFLPFTLNAELQIEIVRVNTGSPGDGTARILFSGSVLQLSTRGTDWTADCGLSNRFSQKVPGFLFQTSDNFSQFDPATQLSAAGFKITGALSAISGMTLTVTGSNKATDWFSAGWLETGALGHGEVRSILKSTVSGSTQTITIDRPLVYAVAGQSIDLYPGYDGSIDQDGTKFGNAINFGGHPYRPDTNPTIKTHEIEQPKGGKK